MKNLEDITVVVVGGLSRGAAVCCSCSNYTAKPQILSSIKCANALIRAQTRLFAHFALKRVQTRLFALIRAAADRRFRAGCR